MLRPTKPLPTVLSCSNGGRTSTEDDSGEKTISCHSVLSGYVLLFVAGISVSFTWVFSLFASSVHPQTSAIVSCGGISLTIGSEPISTWASKCTSAETFDGLFELRSRCRRELQPKILLRHYPGYLTNKKYFRCLKKQKLFSGFNIYFFSNASI